MVKKVCKYILIILLGLMLACIYSFILYSDYNIETIIVFILMYGYLLVFMKFLIRLFK